MKTRWRKRSAWLLAPALGVFLFALALWRSQSTGYKRFVSPPLPDGTRYTFLYPAHYNRVVTGGSFVSMTNAPQPAPLRELMERLRLLRSPSNSIQSGIAVGVVPSSSRLQVKNLDATNWSGRQMRRYDPKSKRIFAIVHSAARPEPFDSEDAVFRPSFQILPSGAPIPSP